MHRLAAAPGGWNPDQEGVVFIEQTPAPIVVLTAADTDIQTLARAVDRLPEDFPAIRVANLLNLQQNLTIDTYAGQVLSQAKVILVRLLGGQSYWSYGLEVVQEVVQRSQAALFVLPGDDRPDPDLISHSTVPLSQANQLWRYLTEGGIDNLTHALQYIANLYLDCQPVPPLPEPVLQVGLYNPQLGQESGVRSQESGVNGKVGILFYRAHYLAGNTAPIDALCQALSDRQLDPVPVFVSSLRDPDVQAEVLQLFQPKEEPPIRVLLNTTSFAIAQLSPDIPVRRSTETPLPTPPPTPPHTPKKTIHRVSTPPTHLPIHPSTRPPTHPPSPSLWHSLNVPVLQVILSGGTVEQWQTQWRGLSPRDMAMNVALPEVDGRIISRAVSFKSVQTWNSKLETDVVGYEPVSDRIQFVADLAANWVSLSQTPIADRKIALILANYPTRNGRLANGVGLDTPASCIEILNALQQTGYTIDNIPTSSDDLIQQLTAGITNDPESKDWRPIHQSLPLEVYQEYFASLPEVVQQGVCERWGRVGNGDQGSEIGEETIQNVRSQESGVRLPRATFGERSVEPSADGSQESGVRSQEAGDRSNAGATYHTPCTALTSIQNPKSFDRALTPKSKIQNSPIPDPVRLSAYAEARPPIPISGLQLGNIFVGIQPARGYDQDPSLNYHAPDLEPTHEYLAFYHWVRQQFGAQAIVHVGKHGNLEWLPGKGIALSESCYPEVAFGPLPHLYPFIVNDPGEGAQAKRRSQAVILDHLTPPMTRAELYGPLQQLERLIDEYYEAQNLDPSRVALIRDRILQLIQAENLHQDLQFGISGSQEPGFPERHSASAQSSRQPTGARSQEKKGSEVSVLETILPQLDGYLCELKEAQIRDGLHIFGQCPEGRQLRDLIIAIARHPNAHQPGLTRAIAQDWGLEFDPLTAELGEGFEGVGLRRERSVERGQGSGVGDAEVEEQLRSCRTVGDAIDQIEHHAALLIDHLLTSPTLPISPTFSHPPTHPLTHSPTHPSTPHSPLPTSSLTTQSLTWIQSQLLPALQQTSEEITHLLRGLNGEYIPAGASGAPTRGRPDVLPTGRNFYSVDIRALPTETAWEVGRKAAEALIERYVQEQGEYPQTLGLSIWGTSTMRTGGDDMAEAIALLGVRPVWEGVARRVVDFEIVPLSVLGRPRVDVTLRISGFFRDAFANLIDLFDQAVAAVVALDEPEDQNPLAAKVRQETAHWQQQGLTMEQAAQRSRYRIFGSKPGAYGAGLQGLIEAQNWTDAADLARAYINWSSYAYTGQGVGHSAPEAFQQRLGQMQVVLHNQDNREHDLLDSDDYYQFQGGLTAAVRSLQGKNPHLYFGDHSQPEKPRVRRLKEEIARVYRSRVVNPKWIAGVMRHGYKGAFEMAATVDYLFAYDATAHCVEDFMYQGIAEAYVFAPEVQQFIQEKNPWALRDMAERLLEAHQRGLWQNVDANTLDQLRAIALQAEALIE